ncbi:MAG: DNA-directed RNA polymerase subunit K [Candidatus Diapherotrites archaeon]|nr:DNA-directed RNA polymerase subunit K [Candidatus Diapherotrites archaeon]
MSDLSAFEITRLLGARSLQLALGAPPLVKVPKGVNDPYILAKLEFSKKKLPLVVIREALDGSTAIVGV